MRTSLLLCVAALVLALPVSAQVDIAVQTGYSFGALVSTPYEQVRLDPSQWYGATVDYHLRRDISLEVSYVYRSGTITERTGSPWQPGRTAVIGDLETHYLQGGTIKTFHSSSDVVVPFIGGHVGLSWFTSTIQGTSTDVFLAVSGVGGAKIYLTDNIGLRLQGRLLMPLFWGSLGFFCGTGGCSAGAGGSGTVEGELSGGLFFSF